MSKEHAAVAGTETTGEPRTTRFLGSLKDALVAAGREETFKPEVPSLPMAGKDVRAAKPKSDTSTPEGAASKTQAAPEVATVPSAESAARKVRGASRPLEDRHIETESPPTTRVVKASSEVTAKSSKSGGPAPTQLVRGKLKVERGGFELDPVVAWLVVVGGPGIGNYRPVFEGNNTVGRGRTNRIPIDFGDDGISSEEQAYIRYDSSDRSFLFVPNLAKTNVVSVNDKKPTGAVELAHMDVITMGRTQLVFVPFCGPEFDWAALAETQKD